MMNDYYILLYRCILYNPVLMQSAEHFALWIVLLLSAAHGAMDKNIENIIVPLLPGQVAIKDWGIFHLTPTMDVIHKVLDDYVEAGMIEYKIDDNGIYIITIINWTKYQLQHDQDTGNTPEATRKHPGNTPEVPRKHPGTNNNKNENNTDNDVYIYSTTFNAISKVLNLGGKPPTPKQQDFIDKWIGEYMFSDDIIICAFNRAKDNGITNVNFKYVDTILDNWHKAGVRTIKDIEKADQEYKEKKKTSKKINNTYYKKNSFTDFTQATTEDFYKAYDENLGYTNEAVPSLQEIMELEESIRARKEKN